MDMAYHIAANQTWLGNKVRGGAVLYLQTEGGQAFNTRLIALRNKYSDFENVNLAVRLRRLIFLTMKTIWLKLVVDRSNW